MTILPQKTNSAIVLDFAPQGSGKHVPAPLSLYVGPLPQHLFFEVPRRLHAAPLVLACTTTPVWARFALPTLRALRVRHELGPDLGGVLAEGGHGAVAVRRGVHACRRRGGAHDARRRADVGAAELGVE